MTLLVDLKKKKLIQPPNWLVDNTQYLVMMGSVAYGVSSDTSDKDIYGWCVPLKDSAFPHLSGEISGFGTQQKRFDQYQQHHIKDLDGKHTYDITIYNVIRYCHLCMEMNPNVVDSLFVTQNCVLHCTQIGEMLRENRKIFLNKKAFHTFKGYAYAQLAKIKNKNRESEARKELIEKHGYDTKFAYHLVRLLLEVEQILVEGDLDLQRHREQLKAIRNGGWAEQQVYDFFNQKESSLEELYHTSTLPYTPNEKAIKQVLLQILEAHYGSLDKCVENVDKYKVLVNKIKELVNE